MAKFKLKLNQDEMKAVGSCCVYAAQSYGKAVSVDSLAILETCERMWSRLRNMYRPDREKYTVRLGAMEARVLTYTVLPALRDSSEPYLRTVGYALLDELRKQIEREVNIYNAMHHGNS